MKGKTREVTAEVVRKSLEKQAQDFVRQKRQRDDSIRENAKQLLNLQNQVDNISWIHNSCERIAELLDELEVETRPTQTAIPVEVAAPSRPEDAARARDESDEILALRAFASDDTTLETTSVNDYSADPPAAPMFGERCLEECFAEVAESNKKVADSVEVLAKLVRDTPQWWNSAIVVRRLKTHAIRANYHGRKVRLWSEQSRSHLFVSSQIVNRIASDSTSELRELKGKQQAIAARRDNELALSSQLGAEEQRLEAEAATLASMLDQVNGALFSEARMRFPAMLPVVDASADDEETTNLTNDAEISLLLGNIEAACVDSSEILRELRKRAEELLEGIRASLG